MLWGVVLWAGLVVSALGRDVPEQGSSDRFGQALEAYRAGDYATAQTLWRSLLSDDLSTNDRAAVLYDLGNAAYRQGEVMEAIAWYESCVRTTPRDTDAWANLEFTRLEAELEPADRGDLGATIIRLLGSVNRTEAAWLILAALGLWLLALIGEALRGSVLWRRLALLGIPLLLLASMPLAWQLTHRAVDPVMVIELPAASLRTEPKDERSPIGLATAGDVVERIDELGDWVRVESPDGIRGWLPRASVFALH